MIMKVAEEHFLSIEITVIKIGLMEWFAAAFEYNFHKSEKKLIPLYFPTTYLSYHVT